MKATAAIAKPDADNVAKSVLDSLNLLAFDDDRQVVVLKVSKEWADEPRVSVKIRLYVPEKDKITQQDVKRLEALKKAKKALYEGAHKRDYITCRECKHQRKKWFADQRYKDGGYWLYWCDDDNDDLGFDDNFCSAGEPKEGGKEE